MALEKEVAAEDRILSGEKDELNHLSDMAKTLMTAAGLFVVVLAAGSWKALADQRTAGEDNLALQKDRMQLALAKALEESKDALVEVRELRDEVERDFPMFARMRNNFGKILRGLEAACSRLQPRDDSYGALSWDEVQQILFYENAVTTSLLIDTGEFAAQLSDIYRLLGVFYGSRYYTQYGSRYYADPPKATQLDDNLSDLDRSRFYFDRSIEFNPENYLACIDGGNFTLYTHTPMSSIAKASQEYWLRACSLGPQYQRPLIGLSMLQLEAFQNPAKALSTLGEALSRREYDLGDAQARPELVQYLQACAYSCMSTSQNEADARTHLSKSMENLRQSSANPTATIKKFFVGGDKAGILAPLAKDPEFAIEFDQIAQILSNPAI